MYQTGIRSKLAISSVLVLQLALFQNAGSAPVKPTTKAGSAKTTAAKKPPTKPTAKTEEKEPVMLPVITEAQKKSPEYDELRQRLMAKVRFCDEVQLQSNCEFAVSPWTLEDKKAVTDALEAACVMCPNLVKKAIAYSPITVYRSRASMKRLAQAYPMYVQGRGNELMFANDFFTHDVIDVFDKYYSLKTWTTIHELVHLADAGHKISSSAKWVKLLPKIFGAQLMTLKMGEDTDTVCWAMGAPSEYAGKNEREALAEYATTMILVKNNPGLMPEVADFVKEHVLNADATVDPSIELNYEGWAVLKSKRSTDADLIKALEKFKKALEIDPNYSEADWGRKLAEMRVEAAAKKTPPQN